MQLHSNKTVMVTGITGFLGSHIAIQLLNQGFNVVGTLRSLARADHIKDIILNNVTKTSSQLAFVECDLTKDDGWEEAISGCDYVIHSASPFLAYIPKHEDQLIKPAVEGALRILKAAYANNVKRVVLTSSIAAVLYGQSSEQQTEDNWSDPNNRRSTPYYKSKTLAEQAAWQYAKASGLSLSVINPGIILGPVLEEDYGTSAELIIKLMNKSLPGLPKIGFTISDVRDVAEAHILAMLNSKAEGERFITAGKFMWMSEIANVLRGEYPDYSIPKRKLPDFVMKIISLFDPAVKTVIKDLGFKHNLSNLKAKRILNWSPRSEKESIIATANSLIQQGIL